MGKPKMWNTGILKMANRRAKRTKIWDSGYYSVPICRVILMPDPLSLVWGHSMYFAKFPILQWILKTLLLSQFSSIHPNFIQGIVIIQAVTFWGQCQKLQKLWHFEIFLNTGPCTAGIFKVLFLPQFSLESIETLWQYWLPW